MVISWKVPSGTNHFYEMPLLIAKDILKRAKSQFDRLAPPLRPFTETARVGWTWSSISPRGAMIATAGFPFSRSFAQVRDARGSPEAPLPSCSGFGVLHIWYSIAGAQIPMPNLMRL